MESSLYGWHLSLLLLGLVSRFFLTGDGLTVGFVAIEDCGQCLGDTLVCEGFHTSIFGIVSTEEGCWGTGKGCGEPRPRIEAVSRGGGA
jgi:hypothetical protein